jgi:predicted nucleic acid-binding protein
MVTADTSFLFSLYGRDANTAKARKLVSRCGKPITVTLFNEFGLGNAVRLSVFQKLLPSEIGAAMLADYEADKADGRVIPGVCNLAEALGEALRLSASETPGGGHRAFDILHVAAAVVMEAENFFTFDDKQRGLARAAGLKV